MIIDIAVLGLARSGISAAMALHAKNTDIRCLGWDADPDRRAAAKDCAAFYKIAKNAEDVLPQADLVILTLPVEDLKSVLTEVKNVMHRNTILVNMSRLQASPARVVKDILGDNARFVSLLPILNPAILLEARGGQLEAREDLFSDSLAYISSPPSADALVLDTAVDLAVLLGSLPVFADMDEVDGLSAANLLLPEMAACALMNAVSGQPSWHDGKTIAAEELAQASEPLADMRVPSSAQELRANRENTARLLDDFIASLQRLKAALLDEDEKKLETFINSTVEARKDWLKERTRAGANKAITSSAPTEAAAMERLLKLGG